MIFILYCPCYVWNFGAIIKVFLGKKKSHTDDIEVLKAHKKKCIKFYILGRVIVIQSATAIFPVRF